MTAMLSLICFAATILFSGASFPIVTIPLDKQYVPVERNNKIVSYKTAYFGQIHLGAGERQQTFSVVFDTGSAHLFVPSTACETETCLRHRRYSRGLSSSAEDIDHHGRNVLANATHRDQVEIAFGTGEVTGEFVRETVCLSGKSGGGDPGSSQPAQECTSLRVILATQMTKEPFNSFDFDGVLGLGLDSLAVDPEFSFFGQMSKLNGLTQDIFGYFLSKVDSVPSEISFGGHDEKRLASDLQWAPVHKPEMGYWQLKLLSVSVAGEKLPLCEDGTCVAWLKLCSSKAVAKAEVDVDGLIQAFPALALQRQLQPEVKIDRRQLHRLMVVHPRTHGSPWSIRKGGTIIRTSRRGTPPGSFQEQMNKPIARCTHRWAAPSRI
ncbi:unnamed protein product [Polarella glacialis]|uniref:Peptidase A1 domain-containing protein n=1 Tax=Polarella glacialis TaxID=89957 RepID=A0A813LZW2_POLGL|nr:unnamed protein product [Polarella glacialis]